MDELKNALTATGYQFAHFGWSKAPAGDYGVHAERATECSVDYFTRDDTGTPKDAIETALAPFAWYLNSIQFEEDTGYIHYEWVVQICG